MKAIAYFSIKDGKKIDLRDDAARKHPIRVSPTTVERERFGGIKGQVETIFDFR